MEFRAIHRHAPISARKVRPVMDMVRGLPVDDALDALKTSHRRGAFVINKVLRSALANAEQAQALSAAELFVKVGRVDEGPLKQGRMRWRPGPMGRIKPIHKRTSHIEIVLGVAEDTSKRRRRRATPEPAPAAAAAEDDENTNETSEN